MMGVGERNVHINTTLTLYILRVRQKSVWMDVELNGTHNRDALNTE